MPFLTPDEREQVGSAYGINTARLCDLKQRYDPDDVFTSAMPSPGFQPHQRWDNANRFDGRMVFVPEGQHDSSQTGTKCLVPGKALRPSRRICLASRARRRTPPRHPTPPRRRPSSSVKMEE